jgi:nicotinate-nucleotide adenylyltransferase
MWNLAYLSLPIPLLIMGADNLGSLHLWKNYAQILAEYELYVYKRPSFEPGELASHPRVKIFEAPPLDISATYIRDCIKAGKSVRYLLPEPVWEYLESGTLYR